MKKGMRKLTALFVAFMMSFALLGTTVSAAAYDTENDLKYVALGDSVSFGMSAVVSLDPVTYQGFAKMFNDYLKTSGKTVDFHNLSEPGDTSIDLLMKLNDPVFQGELSGANVVTINIGANNLLIPLVGAALNKYGYVGSPEEIDYDILFSSIRTLLKKNWYSIDRTMKPYSDLATNDALKGALDFGLQAFKGDWATIIEKVIGLVPDATIIVNELYNPLAYGDPLYNLANTYITKINGIIVANAGSGYKVAKVYDAFRGYEKNRLAVTFSMKNSIMAALVNNKSLFMISLDPHPTLLGHTLIFKQVLLQYR